MNDNDERRMAHDLAKFGKCASVTDPDGHTRHMHWPDAQRILVSAGYQFRKPTLETFSITISLTNSPTGEYDL